MSSSSRESFAPLVLLDIRLPLFSPPWRAVRRGFLDVIVMWERRALESYRNDQPWGWDREWSLGRLRLVMTRWRPMEEEDTKSPRGTVRG